jgi:GNAT superfamily N-acetyltransferase
MPKQLGKQSIVRATPKDIDEVFNILSTATKWLAKQGMDHWKTGYTFEKVQKRLKEKEVYLVYYRKKAVATVSLSTTPASYYTNLTKRFWEDRNAEALYVTGLATLPEYMGRGLAKKLMKFCEDAARERGIKFIRLDAVSYYKELLEFYLKMGYKRVGEEPGRIAPSTYFEKRLF